MKFNNFRQQKDSDMTALYHCIAVPKLTTEIYHTDNWTALTDALGQAITEIKNFIDKLDEDLKPGKVSFFVSTDGEENSSKIFNQK